MSPPRPLMSLSRRTVISPSKLLKNYLSLNLVIRLYFLIVGEHLWVIVTFVCWLHSCHFTLVSGGGALLYAFFACLVMPKAYWYRYYVQSADWDNLKIGLRQPLVQVLHNNLRLVTYSNPWIIAPNKEHKVWMNSQSLDWLCHAILWLSPKNV